MTCNNVGRGVVFLSARPHCTKAVQFSHFRELDFPECCSCILSALILLVRFRQICLLDSYWPSCVLSLDETHLCFLYNVTYLFFIITYFI